MQLSQKQMAIVGGGAVLLLILGYLTLTNLRSSETPPLVTLNVWGSESADAMGVFAERYRAHRPNVTVNYRQFSEASFERSVIDALAAGEGPDVILIPNRAIPKFANKLAPAPSTVISAVQMDANFPTVVNQELVVQGRVYAMPLYLDTLALFWSKDAFDQAALIRAPRTWKEFVDFVPYLRKTNENGQIVRAAAALGGSKKSVAHATDILTGLFFQNGVRMVDDNGSPTFADDVGTNAFNFYMQFADSGSPSYTWNDEQPVSLSAFGAGKAAMAFGYESDLAALKRVSPYADVAVAPMPQISTDTARTVARYLAFAVTRVSENPTWAWDFATYSTQDVDTIVPYLEATHHPPALKSLISQVVNDPSLGVFARQALTARSWYDPDHTATAAALDEAIRAVLTGRTDSSRALREAQEKVSQLLTPLR